MLNRFIGTKIAVFDDDAQLRKLIADGLRARGFVVKEAEDAVSGVQLAADQMPALIVTDVQMPGADGFSVFEQLKLNERTAHIPVIFITGIQDPNIEEKVPVSRLVRFHRKPVEIKQILKSIDELLEASASPEVDDPEVYEAEPEPETAAEPEADASPVKEPASGPAGVVRISEPERPGQDRSAERPHSPPAPAPKPAGPAVKDAHGLDLKELEELAEPLIAFPTEGTTSYLVGAVVVGGTPNVLEIASVARTFYWRVPRAKLAQVRLVPGAQPRIELLTPAGAPVLTFMASTETGTQSLAALIRRWS